MRQAGKMLWVKASNLRNRRNRQAREKVIGNRRWRAAITLHLRALP